MSASHSKHRAKPRTEGAGQAPAPGAIDPRLLPAVAALVNLLIADLTRHPPPAAPTEPESTGEPGGEPSPTASAPLQRESVNGAKQDEHERGERHARARRQAVTAAHRRRSQ